MVVNFKKYFSPRLSTGLLIMFILVSSLFLFGTSVKAVDLSVQGLEPDNDDLIGAVDTTWRFNVTTTASLSAGDVIQFIFPSVNNGQGFSATNVTTTFPSLYTSLSTSTSTSLLANGNFDGAWVNDFSSWIASGFGGDLSVGYSLGLSTTSHAGLYGAQFVNASGGNKGILMQTYNGLTLADSYTGHVWAKNSGSGNLGVYYIIFGDNGSPAKTWNFVGNAWEDGFNPALFKTVTVSSTYAEYTIDPVTVDASTTISVGFIGADDNSEIFIDDFSMLKDNSSPNIAVNGNLETIVSDYPSSWTEGQAGSTDRVTLVTSTVQSGSNAVKLYNVDANDVYIYQKVTGLTPSSSILASLYNYTVLGNPQLIFLDDVPGSNSMAWNFQNNVWDANTNTMSGLSDMHRYFLNTSSAWVQTTSSIIASPSGTITMALYATGPGEKDFYVDTASLTQTVTTTAVVGVGNGVQGSGPSSQPVVYGLVESDVPTSTAFQIDLSGINNPIAMRSVLENLTFTVKAGSATDNLAGDLLEEKFSVTSTASVDRLGGNLIVDGNTGVFVGSTAVNAITNYTFNFTPTTSIPIGGVIVLTFPTSYASLLGNISVNTSSLISLGNNTTSTINSFTTSTGFLGSLKISLVVDSQDTLAGDPLSIVINSVTNPATAGVYGSQNGDPSERFNQYTVKSDGGLVDGSIFGFEGANDYQGPPPPSSVTIGGNNTVNILVYKQTDSGNVALNASEIAQVKVSMGNPDKGYFVGSKFLNSSSLAQYTGLLDGNYLIGVEPLDKSGGSFYDSFLAPGMKSISLLSSGGAGTTVTTSIFFGVPDATTTLTITGGKSGEFAAIEANSDYFQSFAPIFTDQTYTVPGFSSTGTGYAQISVKSGQNWNFNVQSGNTMGTNTNFSSGTIKFWPPSIPSQYISTSSTIDLGSFAYTQADKRLNVTLRTAGTDEIITNACVGVKRPGGMFFMGAQDTICTDQLQQLSTTTYAFSVPSGAIAVSVSRPGMGKPEEYPVAINANTVNKTIYLTVPTSYISVLVRDGSLNAIRNASVFVHGTSFGQGMTGSTGTTTIYVPAGTYSVDGYAPGLGPLTTQSNVTVSEGVNPSVTFTIDTNALNTISGRVTVGGTGVSGVKIGARGTASTKGGNGTETDSSGNYTLYVPAGTYEVGGWSPDTGGIEPKTAVFSDGSATVNWVLDTQYTLRITINSSTNVSPLFAGAFNASTGRGNGSDSWTTSGNNKYTDIRLPGGTYEVQAGSPMIGEIGNTTVVLDSDKSVAFDLPEIADFATISGSVSVFGGSTVNANVWASKTGGEPGFYSTQTDSDGNYSLKLPKNKNYIIGVKAYGYIADNGDENLSVTTADQTKDFTLITADNPIVGTVKTAGNVAITNAWVSAKKVILGGRDVWAGAPTDGAGNYSLAVDSGTWTVYAEAPGYERSSGTSASAGATSNLVLSARAGYTAPTTVMQGITDTSGGQMSDGNTTIDIPANALGSGSSVVSVSLSTTTPRQAPNATPLSRSAVTVSASDSTGQAITSLNSKATLTITLNDDDYTELKIPASQLNLAYFDETNGQWETMAATFDAGTKKFNVQTNHFTDFSPVVGGPDAPTGLTSTSTVSGQVDLSWTASIATTTYYVIYATTTDISAFPTSTLLATTTATSYSHSSLTGGTTWYYKVAAYNDLGEGVNSDRANATVTSASTPSAPTGLTALAASASQINLTWSTVSGATYYSVYSSTDNYTTALTTTTGLSYSNTGLTANTSYSYKVSATNDSGEGSKSSSVSATTQNSGGSGSSSGGGASLVPITPDLLNVGTTPIEIASGVTSVTDPIITLKLNVSSAVMMAISENQNFIGASWEPYSRTRNFQLSSGLGLKTIYAKFKNEKGTESSVFNVKITLAKGADNVLNITKTVEDVKVETKTEIKTEIQTVKSDKPESKVILDIEKTKYSYQPGEKLQFKYSFKNDTSKRITVKIVRQLLNNKGKVIKTVTASRYIKAGGVFQGVVDELIGKYYSPGEYVEKIKITVGKITEENSFKINVEPLKKKYFILAGEISTPTSVAFDQTTWNKIKTNVSLPANFKLKYSYTNSTDQKQTVRMLRELISPEGKVLTKSIGKWTMAVGEKDGVTFTQAVASKLAPGDYTVKITATDWKTGQVLAQNQFGFRIELK